MKPSVLDSPQPDFDLIKAFNRRAGFRWGDYKCTLRREKHHPLVLPSGKIMVGDPVWFERHPNPLQFKVSPDAYPVDVAFRVAHNVHDRPDAGAYEDLALVKITFSKNLVVKWAAVTTWGIRNGMSKPGNLMGLPILSRYDVVCFTDAATIKRHQKADTLENLISDSVSQDGSYSQIVVDLKTGANIVQVPSGMGACLNYPGRQGLFWGLDADGEPVCLMTDFGALSQRVRESLSVGSIGQLIKDKTTTSGPFQVSVSREAGVSIQVRGVDVSDIYCTVNVRGKSNYSAATYTGGTGKCVKDRGVSYYTDPCVTYIYDKTLPDTAELAITYTDRIEPLI